MKKTSKPTQPRLLPGWILVLASALALASPLLAQKPAKDPLAAAKKLYASGKRAEAKLILERLVKGKSPRAEAHSILGMILVEPPLEKRKLAAAHFQRAMEINPSDVHGHLGAGIVLIRSGHPRRALPFLDKATKLAPGYDSAHLNYGKALYQLSRYEDALVQFSAAGKNSEALEYLAIVESRRNRPLVGAKHLDTLLSIQPQNSPQRPRLFYQRGALLLLGGKDSEAQKSFESSLALGFERAELLNAMGDLAYERGDLKVAELHYRRALVAKPIEPGPSKERDVRAKSRYELGLIAFRRKSFEAAAEELEASLAIDPFHPNAWYKLGQTRQRLKDGKRAREAFARHRTIAPLHQKLRSAELSLANDPSVKKNWLAAGQLALSLGRPRKALKHLLFLEKLAPQFPGLATALADCAQALGLKGQEARYRQQAEAEKAASGAPGESKQPPRPKSDAASKEESSQ